jgi:hypothetical protein
MPAVVNLFKLLDRRPELLREILPERRRRSTKVRSGADPVKERA